MRSALRIPAMGAMALIATAAAACGSGSGSGKPAATGSAQPVQAVKASGGNPGGTATSTITFSGYGTPVNLSPPSASQTADITSQVIQQSGTGSG